MREQTRLLVFTLGILLLSNVGCKSSSEPDSEEIKLGTIEVKLDGVLTSYTLREATFDQAQDIVGIAGDDPLRLGEEILIYWDRISETTELPVNDEARPNCSSITVLKMIDGKHAYFSSRAITASILTFTESSISGKFSFEAETIRRGIPSLTATDGRFHVKFKKQ